ncbi:MAG: NAD(P)H-dependent oxidoreductase [Acidimicrobiia bacterium]|nr:NAD(P)H-dependent oxidoreductase [Acidimicrobiia bacterium]
MEQPTGDRQLSVLAFPGSLRAGSYNRALLHAAAALAPDRMTIDVYDGLIDIPLFNADFEDPEPTGVTALRNALAGVDGVLISTPEYNQSVPGVLKNVIDWLSRQRPGLGGVPVAVTGVTTGPWGTRLAQTQLRQMLGSVQALVMTHPLLYLKGATDLFDGAGELTDESTADRLSRLLIAFGNWIDQVNPDQ